MPYFFFFFLFAHLFAQKVDTLFLLKESETNVWEETATRVIPEPSPSQGLQWEGQKTLQLQAQKSILLNQSLDLRLYGPLDSNWNLSAELRESDLPIDSEGDQVTLREFDYLFFQIENPWSLWRLGNSAYTSKEGFLWQERRDFVGAQLRLKSNLSEVRSGTGGEFAQKERHSFKTVGGQQSGYFVQRNTFQSIRPFSENIWLDGELLKRDHDYKIEYATGVLQFTAVRALKPNQRVETEYLTQVRALQNTITYGEILQRFPKITWAAYAHLENTSLDSLRSATPTEFLQNSTSTQNQDNSEENKYWLKKDQWVSIHLEAPLEGSSLFDIEFMPSDKGSYVLRGHLDSTGRYHYYYVHQEKGTHTPSVRNSSPLENTNFGLSLHYHPSKEKHLQVEWQGNQRKSTYLDSSLYQRVRWRAQYPFTKFKLYSKGLYHKPIEFIGPPSFSSHSWTKEYELPLKDLEQTEWLFQEQGISLTQKQLIHRLEYSSLHFTRAYQDAYSLLYGLNHNKKSSPKRFEIQHYLLNKADQEQKIKQTLYSSLAAHAQALKPYTETRLTHLWPAHQGWNQWRRREWLFKSGLPYHGHTLNKEIYISASGIQTQTTGIEDSLITHSYGTQGSHQPHTRHLNRWSLSLNRHWHTQTKTIEESQFILAEYLRRYEDEEGLWKENWNIVQSQGTQYLLRKKYEPVPEGTGDVLFDPSTQEFIENVAHGNYRFAGMERDSSSTNTLTRQLDFSTQLEFSRPLSPTASGFLRT